MEDFLLVVRLIPWDDSLVREYVWAVALGAQLLVQEIYFLTSINIVC